MIYTDILRTIYKNILQINRTEIGQFIEMKLIGQFMSMHERFCEYIQSS